MMKYILASIFLILPLCYAKQIDFLKYASALATFGVIYFVFLTAYIFYATPSNERPNAIKTAYILFILCTKLLWKLVR